MAYYGKLPIVLLSEIASAREDSYRCRIAAYLIGRMGDDVTAEEIARDCFVSKSAVSRFCREIGLEDFIELKELLRQADKTFEIVGTGKDPSIRAGQFVQEAGSSMERAAAALDYQALDRLVGEIVQAERIVCFGMLKAETAAINLHSDLTMLGKQAMTKVSFKDQMDFLSQSQPEDLVVIVSYRGIFFDYDLPVSIREGKARIWVVTGQPEAAEALKKRPMVHDILSFSSALDFVSHPYQLLTVSSIIAQETARRLADPRRMKK